MKFNQIQILIKRYQVLYYNTRKLIIKSCTYYFKNLKILILKQ